MKIHFFDDHSCSTHINRVQSHCAKCLFYLKKTLEPLFFVRISPLLIFYTIYLIILLGQKVKFPIILDWILKYPLEGSWAILNFMIWFYQNYSPFCRCFLPFQKLHNCLTLLAFDGGIYDWCWILHSWYQHKNHIVLIYVYTVLKIKLNRASVSNEKRYSLAYSFLWRSELIFEI